MTVSTIAAIDKEIDAVRKTLLSLHPIKNTLHPGAWQAAWDAHPELAERHAKLFQERGEAQLELARREYEAAMRAPKPTRAKKCPTCGRAA